MLGSCTLVSGGLEKGQYLASFFHKEKAVSKFVLECSWICWTTPARYPLLWQGIKHNQSVPSHFPVVQTRWYAACLRLVYRMIALIPGCLDGTRGRQACSVRLSQLVEPTIDVQLL